MSDADPDPDRFFVGLAATTVVGSLAYLAYGLTLATGAAQDIAGAVLHLVASAVAILAGAVATVVVIWAHGYFWTDIARPRLMAWYEAITAREWTTGAGGDRNQ